MRCGHVPTCSTSTIMAAQSAESFAVPKSSNSEHLLQLGPSSLFEYHLKVLTDSYLYFFQERCA